MNVLDVIFDFFDAGLTFSRPLKGRAVKAREVPPALTDDGSGIEPGQMIEVKCEGMRGRENGITIASKNGLVYFQRISLIQQQGSVSFKLNIPLAPHWWVLPEVWVAKKSSIRNRNLSIGEDNLERVITHFLSR